MFTSGNIFTCFVDQSYYGAWKYKSTGGTYKLNADGTPMSIQILYSSLKGFIISFGFWCTGALVVAKGGE